MSERRYNGTGRKWSRILSRCPACKMRVNIARIALEDWELTDEFDAHAVYNQKGTGRLANHIQAIPVPDLREQLRQEIAKFAVEFAIEIADEYEWAAERLRKKVGGPTWLKRQRPQESVNLGRAKGGLSPGVGSRAPTVDPILTRSGVTARAAELLTPNTPPEGLELAEGAPTTDPILGSGEPAEMSESMKRLLGKVKSGGLTR